MFRSAQQDPTTGPVPLEMAVSSRRNKHFFRKVPFRLDETPWSKIGGVVRGPTPGPRNLNENPAPEELSGKSSNLFGDSIWNFPGNVQIESLRFSLRDRRLTLGSHNRTMVTSGL